MDIVIRPSYTSLYGYGIGGGVVVVVVDMVVVDNVDIELEEELDVVVVDCQGSMVTLVKNPELNIVLSTI